MRQILEILKRNRIEISLIVLFGLVPYRSLFVVGVDDFKLRLIVLAVTLLLLYMKGKDIITFVVNSITFQTFLFVGLFIDEVFSSSLYSTIVVGFLLGSLLPMETTALFQIFVFVGILLQVYFRFNDLVFETARVQEVHPFKNEEDFNWESAISMLSLAFSSTFVPKVENRLKCLGRVSYPLVAKRYIFEGVIVEGIKSGSKKHIPLFVTAGLAGYGINEYKDYRLKSQQQTYDHALKNKELDYNREIQLKQLEALKLGGTDNGLGLSSLSRGLKFDKVELGKNIKAPSMASFLWDFLGF